MIQIRSAVISLPWDDYQRPSLPIGCLSAYAKEKGYSVEAFHLNLEAASLFGFDDYDCVINNHYSGEILCASILFPENRKKILAAVRGQIPSPDSLAARIHRALRKSYRGIGWHKYGLVGFSINHDQLFSSLVMAGWIKDSHPDIKIVFGGRSVSGKLGQSVLESFPQVDWCIDGEGEIALVSLLREMQEGKGVAEENVPGLMYRRDCRVLCNPQRQLPDLNSLPDPDFDHYFRQIETGATLSGREIQPYLPIEMSRGCSFNCAYCSERNFFKGLRHRPAGEISESLARLFKLYRIPSIFLIAQMVTPGHCRELFDEIASHDSDYKLFAEIRANLSKDDLVAMKKAGMTQVQIGIEALDSNLLRKMNKGTRLMDNLRILKHCEEIGIRHVSNLIVGFPTETQDDIDRSAKAVEFAIAYRPPAFFSEFKLREDSLVYRHPEKYDIREIDDAAVLGRHLPQTTRKGLRLWNKSYKSSRKRRNYGKLRHHYKRWKKTYEEAEAIGKPLLYYLDFHDVLRIEDLRGCVQSVLIDGWIRDIYLYCDETRSFDEIRSHFPRVPENELRRTLNRLFKLRLMYAEDNDWLSLAIRSSPANRRHMPFL
jgi:ribosomal peptide maturation radical SAM protein 1